MMEVVEMGSNLLLRIANNLFLLFLIALLASCSSSGSSTPDVVTDNLVTTISPSNTVTTEETNYAPSPIPTFANATPAFSVSPTVDYTSTAEAIEETIIKTVTPQSIRLSDSPDKNWHAELLKFKCTKVNTNALSENSYDILQIVNNSTSEELFVTHQIQNCDGVGAFGLGEVVWSENSQFYYFTDAREGTPDGGPLGWMPTIYRFDVLRRTVEDLGPGKLSPSKSMLATSEVWFNGELNFAPRSFIIWHTNGNKIVDYDVSFTPGSWGFHRVAWSSSDENFVYIETECPENSKCISSLYLVNLISLHRETLLQKWQPSLESVSWGDNSWLLLTDANFDQWKYNLSERNIEKHVE